MKNVGGVFGRYLAVLVDRARCAEASIAVTTLAAAWTAWMTAGTVLMGMDG